MPSPDRPASDHEAVSHWVRDHGRAVRGYLLGLVRRVDVVEDLLQAVTPRSADGPQTGAEPELGAQSRRARGCRSPSRNRWPAKDDTRPGASNISGSPHLRGGNDWSGQ